MSVLGFFSKENKESLNKGLEKTKESLLKKISRAVVGKSRVDDEVLDNLEEILISSDVGVETTLRIIERIQKRASIEKILNTSELNQLLKSEIAELLAENKSVDSELLPEKIDGNPYVIMVVGVNGVGKTTTIGKLAYLYKNAGKSVVIGAADTFRAAAVDQITIWAERVGVPIVKQQMGADPASVAFDAAQQALAKDATFLIVDTAGRMHTKNDLMDQLGKVRRVIEKVIPVKEVLLVIDATTGQNGLNQAKVFAEAVAITGIILTKMDGSARGGIALAIERELGIPIKWLGTGESVTDFVPFEPEAYIRALL